MSTGLQHMNAPTVCDFLDNPASMTQLVLDSSALLAGKWLRLDRYPGPARTAYEITYL